MSEAAPPEQAEQRSSVKITENAKHETQVEVKVYAGTFPAELDETRELAVRTFKQTRAGVSS